jgi:RNA ligase (TIGR02306 family)
MKHLARVVTFILKSHPNADTLSLAQVQGTGWQCVVRTADWVGSASTTKEVTPEGDCILEGIYVSLDALLDPAVPEFAFLANKATKKFSDGRPGHRVKTIRLRGMISQGLVIPIPDGVRHTLLTVPADVQRVHAAVPHQAALDAVMPLLDPAGPTTAADLENLYICEALKIERYEPPIPVDMSGQMVRSPVSFVHYTDIENAKNHPSWFTEADQVRVTEKIHGTNFRVGMVFDGKEAPEYIVGSHTTAKLQVPLGGSTLYAVMAERHFPEARMREVVQNDNGKWPFNEHFIVFGEVYGDKVQDLTYGCARGTREVRIYDVVIDHVYQPWETIQKIAELFGIQTVPLLYRGQFNAQVVQGLRDGKSTLATHVREGCVVTAEPEVRVVDEDGSSYRKILKFISDEYLCRAGEKDGH